MSRSGFFIAIWRTWCAEYAGHEALRLASAEDDLYATRLALGADREAVEADAEVILLPAPGHRRQAPRMGQRRRLVSAQVDPRSVDLKEPGRVAPFGPSRHLAAHFTRASLAEITAPPLVLMT